VVDASGLTDTDLFEYTEHLAYEVGMLRFALTWPERTKDFHQNLLFEAAVLHARNLIDFLYPRRGYTAKRYPEDVLWFHFVDSSWQPPPPVDELEDLRSRADKELAHLTTRRRTDEYRDAKLYPIAPFETLLERLAEFTRKASPEKLDTKSMSKALEVLPQGAVRRVVTGASTSNVGTQFMKPFQFDQPPHAPQT